MATNTITATYAVPRNNQRLTQQLAQVNALSASGLGQADGANAWMYLSQNSFNAAVVGDEIQIVIVWNTVQPAFDAAFPTQADATKLASNLWNAAIGALTKNLPCRQVSLVIA